MNLKNARLETLCLHAGQTIDSATNARAVPLYRTTAYQFNSTEHAANLFALKELGNIYTRVMNPTHAVLEERVAALEGGVAAVALSSGTSGVFYSVINICRAGDEIVSANNLYGGTYTMFNDILPQFNITTKFVDPSSSANFAAAVTEKTKMIFVETIGNPLLDVVDLDAVAEVARRNNIPLVVDSTFTPPPLLRPIDHGADVVIHSLTKWMGGHGVGVGGIVVDAGRFKWGQEKFPLFHLPEPSYHGVRFGHDLGDLQPAAFAIRLRVIPLRNLGACISPDNAWMFIQGIETLPLRIERHCRNAEAVANYLAEHSSVEWVRYPGRADHHSQSAAKKLLRHGMGAMVIFGIKGGKDAGRKFIESLELFSHLANVGDAKSLAIHPATTTHSQLSEEQQREAGITPELVRLSIGLEHIDDITADLAQALEKAST